ncbi:MAG: hypothetical protein WC477_04495 [Patescibacteria group bacterium]
MDRRTKIILLSIGSVILLGAILWFFVWPLLQPELQKARAPQPPEIGQQNPPAINNGSSPSGQTNTPSGNIKPSEVNPDLLQIEAMSRRAGVLAERVESGTSGQEFKNLNDATLDASPDLIKLFDAKRKELMKQHPVNGSVYSTIARALVEIPEAQVLQTDVFHIRVQMQVQTNNNGNASVGYLEATVTYKRQGANWLAVDYSSAPYQP